MPMQPCSDTLEKIEFLVGDIEAVSGLTKVMARKPFELDVIEYLNDVSRIIMNNSKSKEYSDVVTFGFWIRKGSIVKLKERYGREGLVLGRGVVFHVSPSNVPVNFAYSLVTGLLMGNANVVKVPGKGFPQIDIIVDALNKAMKTHPQMKSYVICVRYGHEKDLNDLFSSMADVRIVWGGNQTIAELRKSELPPRSLEISFADRFSIAVIDSDYYLSIEHKERLAESFYNDTFLFDQNACTSPKLLVWMGDRIEEAKVLFWNSVHDVVAKKYFLSPIQAVNKLNKIYLVAVTEPNVKVEKEDDNLIVRVLVPHITDGLSDYYDKCGFFYEYNCSNILDLLPVCNDKRCQTVSYVGDFKIVLPLIDARVKGIDRIVPMGKTMNFDLIWDGFDLPALLSRTITVE